MKTQLLGISLRPANPLTVADLLNYAHSRSGEEIRYLGQDRLFSAAFRSGCLVGLLITIRDNQKLASLRRKHTQGKSAFEISINTLEAGESLFDFNFFAVNVSTGRGLYQHYHRSCSAHQFCGFMGKLYDQLRKDKLNVEKKKGWGKVFKRRVREAYKGRLGYGLMVRPEDLKSLLECVDHFAAFEFDLEALSKGESAFTPLKPYLRRESHRLQFKAHATQSGMIQKILNTINALNITKGRVRGKMVGTGEDIAFSIESTLDCFGEYELSDLLAKEVLDPANVARSPFIEKMLAQMDEHKPRFTMEAKP